MVRLLISQDWLTVLPVIVIEGKGVESVGHH